MFVRATENPGQYLNTIKNALEFLKEKSSTVTISAIPLDSYHMCLPRVDRAWTIVQISLSLGFGKCLVTLPNYPSISSD